MGLSTAGCLLRRGGGGGLLLLLLLRLLLVLLMLLRLLGHPPRARRVQVLLQGCLNMLRLCHL
jgi:hypothetical protein